MPSLYIVQKWISVGMTMEQVVLGQLAAIDPQSQDMETNAHCLLLRGKYLRLLAVQEDPLYHCALWDRHKQVDKSTVFPPHHVRAN